ncbi:protein-tyrosine phosphatase-like protein [Globomyces pollinis-pini]|nr:protein-tyrosine phosphatase-like protein [Globomyces pollinis-pini]
MTIEIFKKLKQTNYLPDWFLINQDLILPSNLRKVYYQIITLDNQRRQDKSKLDQFSFSNSIKNTHLNRYSDICAYDYNRVILNHQLDYINASWLTSLGNQTKYIAAQGPLKSSFADFWQMVWEQSVNLIVMLTPEEEKGRIKCHHYCW